LADFGVCPPTVAAEIAAACEQITAEEGYEEEARIQHNSRALVNCPRHQVLGGAKPYVHLFATSADIMDTARALCLVEVTRSVIVPDLLALEKQPLRLAAAHADH